MGSFLSDTLPKAFSSKYVYFKIHDSNIATVEFLVVSAETYICWEIKIK